MFLLNMCSSSSRDTETFVGSESCFESLMLPSLMKYFLAPLCCSSLHLNFWLIHLQVLDWQWMVVPEYFRAFPSTMLESSLCLHLDYTELILWTTYQYNWNFQGPSSLEVTILEIFLYSFRLVLLIFPLVTPFSLTRPLS